MKPRDRVTRRKSLRTIGAGIAGLSCFDHHTLLASPQADRTGNAQPRKFRFFDPDTAREIEAMAAQIIPSGSTPGAREAGVIHFIDRALATFDRDQAAVYRAGVANLNLLRMARYPGSRSLGELSSEQQVEFLRGIEKSEFFEAVRLHTITGFLAHPRWGGNRGGAGWKLIGFEDRHVFEPPFGYYDDPAFSREGD